MFTYSHEEGTTAYDLPDTIPAEEKERRAQEIMDVQQEISFEKNQQKVGQTLETGSGEIKDALRGGEIRIRLSPGAGR